MLSEITQETTTAEIAQELRETLAPLSAGGRLLPGASPRVGAVEAWLDLRRRADGPTKLKIDDAIQQALTATLAESTIDFEVVCAHLRVLRLALQEGPDVRRVNADAKDAVLHAIQSERYKDKQTSYGDTHAELLACVEALRLAPNWDFWRIQMYDSRYVTHAVSGCLGSGNEQFALSGVIRAAKLGDRSLALALMRLFRMFQGRESLVCARFEEARRNGAWNRQVFARVSRSMAQIGQSCPADPVLAIEETVASLREQLRAKDRLLKEAQAKAEGVIRGENRIKTQIVSPLERIQTIQTKQKTLQAEYEREFRQLEVIASSVSEDVQAQKYEESSLEQAASKDVQKTLLPPSARSTQRGASSIDSKGTKPQRANDISRAEQAA